MIDKPFAFLDQLPVYQAAGGGLFSPDPGLVIWTWLVFFVMLFILYRFAWNPILKSLNEREEKIKQAIENAERVDREVKEIAEKNQQVLTDAKVEAQKIIADSKEEGERLRSKIKAQAEREALELVEKTKLSINEAKREAIDELRRESVHLSIEIASKIIGENLDNKKNQEFAEKHLNNL